MPQHQVQTTYQLLVDADNPVEANSIAFEFWRAVERYDRGTAEAYLTSRQIVIVSSIVAEMPEGMKDQEPTPARPSPTLPKREGEEQD